MRIAGFFRKPKTDSPKNTDNGAVNAIWFEFSPIRVQWFCHLDGLSEWGRGKTQADALYDLFIHAPELFNVNPRAIMIRVLSGSTS